MRPAVAAARSGQIVQALAGFQRALAMARGLIEQPPPARADDCVAALVVSHHNLADLLAQEGDTEAAAELIGAAHRTLIALAVDARRDAELQRAALCHSRETHVALLRFTAEHGPQPSIAQALGAATQALAAVDGPAH